MTPTTKPERIAPALPGNPAWREVPYRSSAPNPAREDLHLLLDVPAIILAAWAIDGGGAALIERIEHDGIL